MFQPDIAAGIEDEDNKESVGSERKRETKKCEISSFGFTL